MFAACSMNVAPSNFAILLALAALFAGGCSNLVPVQGEVKLDGQPLQAAQVMFVPKTGRPATGKTDAQGRFRLTTNTANDGVAPGDYIVTVTANKVEYETKPGSENGFVEKLTWVAPEKYSRPSESGLSQTITPATKEVKIELQSAGGLP